MLFIVDAVLIGAFALLACALLRPSTRIALVLGIYVLSYASLVFAAELAGALFILGKPVAYIAIHVLLVWAAGMAWQRAGCPPIFSRVSGLPKILRLKEDPVLWAFASGVGLLYLFAGVMLFFTVPTTPDTMTYHLSRIGYWLQHHSLYPWPTPDLRQTAFPFNAELAMLWPIMFLKSDQAVELVTWCMVPISMAAIAGTTRVLGYTWRQGLFAALIWATLPQIYLQAVNAKSDLVICSLAASACYLLLLGLRSSHKGDILLSSLAIGLAAGTKTTLLLIAPGLAIWLVLLAIHYGSPGIRLLRLWIIASLIAFILLGAYNYVLNLYAYGHPLGPPDFVKSESRPRQASNIEMLTVNVSRYLYQSLDVTGLPRPVAVPLQRAKTRFARWLFGHLGLDVNSLNTALRQFRMAKLPWVELSEAWYGPLGAVLLFLLIPIKAVFSLLKKNWPLFGPALLALSFLAMLSLTLFWDPWRGRFALLAVTLVAPYYSSVYHIGKFSRIITWGFCGLALIVLIWTMRNRLYDPVLPDRPMGVFNVLVGQRPAVELPLLRMRRMVDEHVPSNATLGLLFKSRDWDYPLFGSRFCRTLVQIYPYPERIDGKWLAQQKFEYLLVNNNLFKQDVPPELTVVKKIRSYTLFRYTGSR